MGSAVPALSLTALSAQLDSAPKSAGVRFAAIIAWAKHAIDDVIDAAGVETIVSHAVALYDRYVAPVDVPWIPDLLEPTLLDLPAKQLLAIVIRGFAELVDVDDESPTGQPPVDDGGLN